MAVNGRVTSVRLPQVYLRWLDRYGAPIGNQIREDLAALIFLSDPCLTELNNYFTVAEACYITEALAMSDYMELANEGIGGALMPLHEVAYHELGQAEERELHKRWKVDIDKFVEKIDAIGIGPLHAYQLYHMARLAATHTGKSLKEFKAEVAKIFKTKE
jgi:hypothetical protein